MQSLIAERLNMKFQPVAIYASDSIPDGASSFKPGKRACVMSLFARAAKGGAAAVSAETCGCAGALIAFGFGNDHAGFPGGEEGFFGFLSCGNSHTPGGRAIGEAIRSRNKAFGDMYLEGEGYKTDPALVKEWHDSLPHYANDKKYVIFSPLDKVVEDDPYVVVFPVNPDQLSALVVLSSYHRPGRESAIAPWASGCQLIGLLPLAEAKSANPRAIIGLTDISARIATRSSLGSDILTVALPYALFREMEENVAGSFMDRPAFTLLSK